MSSAVPELAPAGETRDHRVHVGGSSTDSAASPAASLSHAGIPRGLNKLDAMAQAAKDVSKVFKMGRQYRFSVFNHATQRWEESPAIGDKEQAEALKSAEQQTARAKEELKAAAPRLQKVRSLDQKLADQKKVVSEGDQGCKKDAAKIDADKKARLEEQEKRSKAHETLDLVDGYLKEHAQDEWLISGLAGVEEQLSGLLSRQKEIQQKKHSKSLKKLIFVSWFPPCMVKFSK